MIGVEEDIFAKLYNYRPAIIGNPVKVKKIIYL